jgi:hypothetical protein
MTRAGRRNRGQAARSAVRAARGWRWPRTRRTAGMSHRRAKGRSRQTGRPRYPVLMPTDAALESTSVTAVTSPCPAPLHQRTPAHRRQKARPLADRCCHLRPRLICGRQVPPRSRAAKVAIPCTRGRNSPGRDVTPNSPERQAPRRAEQDVTTDRVALVLVPRRAGRPAPRRPTHVRPLRQLPPRVQADLAPACRPSGHAEFEEQAAARSVTERG